MKEAPRGPFSRIRWFCADGTVLPPKAYACSPHGGGVQHGEWADRTLKLRADGYLVANLLAGIQPEQALSDPDFENAYGQRLVERFLIAMDDGWIFRRALFYRGAIQEEDERAGGRSLLLAMLSDEQWIGPHFVALRTGVKLLPHGADNASAGKVRQLSASLSEDDPPFMPIRIKIHGAPEASDADRVRAYQVDVEDAALRARYEELAEEIDRLFMATPLPEQLNQLAGDKGLPQTLRRLAGDSAKQWQEAGASGQMAISGKLLAAIRDALPEVKAPAQRLALMAF